MGAVEASVEIIKAALWPAVVVLVLIVWRQELLKLVPRIEELSGGPSGLKVRFREEVQAVAETARKVDSEAADTASVESNTIRSELFALAQEQPLAAILTSWNELEHLAADALGANGLPMRRPALNVRQAAGKLSAAGRMDAEYVDLAAQLSTVRNQAVHQSPHSVDPPTALAFIEATDSLASAFLRTIPSAS